MLATKSGLRVLLVAGVTALTSACASGGAGGAAAATAPPGAPVELDGTKWKLAFAKGKLDGRVIEFKKEGGVYAGYLVEPGLQLRDVHGVRPGMRFFSLEKTQNVNEYRGFYEAPGPDGVPVPRDVVVSVSGDTFTWNLEAVTWSRVE